jgi:hypothetical protein
LKTIHARENVYPHAVIVVKTIPENALLVFLDTVSMEAHVFLQPYAPQVLHAYLAHQDTP